MAINFLFDILAPVYDKVIKPRKPEDLVPILDLPMDGWLLDVGGGTGRVSSGLINMISRLVICDLSEPMLRKAQEKEGIYPVQGKSHHLPFEDHQFDRVLVVDALHHFSDQSGAISELLRVLRPGGRLLIEEPDIRRFPVQLVAMGEKIALMKSHFHSPCEIKAMIAANGYSASIESDGQYAAWIIVRK